MDMYPIILRFGSPFVKWHHDRAYRYMHCENTARTCMVVPHWCPIVLGYCENRCIFSTIVEVVVPTGLWLTIVRAPS